MPLSNGLSLVTCVASINQKSFGYTFTVDPGAYASAALKGVSDFDVQVARVATQPCCDLGPPPCITACRAALQGACLRSTNPDMRSIHYSRFLENFL